MKLRLENNTDQQNEKLVFWGKIDKIDKTLARLEKRHSPIVIVFKK